MPRMKWPVFKLEINMGDDAMQSGADIANALRRTADRIAHIPVEKMREKDSFPPIFDANGNNCGTFKIVIRKEI
jgi:hypothetical protein